MRLPMATFSMPVENVAVTGTLGCQDDPAMLPTTMQEPAIRVPIQALKYADGRQVCDNSKLSASLGACSLSRPRPPTRLSSRAHCRLMHSFNWTLGVTS